MATNKTICVFCSSSDAVDQSYFAAAEELGNKMAEKGYDLAYGGGAIGLMGELARAVQAGGQSVYGVIPDSLNLEGICYPDAEELIVTKDLRERKAIMEEKADAFIVLPGGFGTLEEAAEIITLKQLSLNNKAIVFLNTNRFFDKLIAFFEEIFKESFAKSAYRDLYFITESVDEALSYIENYEPFERPKKWF